MKSINYFNQFPQGEAFVERFGDFNCDGLPASAQVLLVSILASRIYTELTGLGARVLNESGNGATEGLEEALRILEGADVDQMTGVIQFLSQ